MQIEKRSRILIDFYNFLNNENVKEIDVETYQRLVLIPYKAVLKTLAKKCILEGTNKSQIKTKYELSDSELRSILEELGIYHPRYQKKRVKLDMDKLI